MSGDTRAPRFDRAKSFKTIKYEYDMAAETAVHVGRDWSTDETAIQFALLESFLVHARNLHEFLRPRGSSSRRRPGDMWADDFIDGFGYLVFDREMVDTINRWLQHITTWRYADDHARWHPIPMLALIFGGMDRFVRDLDETPAPGPLEVTHRHVASILRAEGLLAD